MPPPASLATPAEVKPPPPPAALADVDEEETEKTVVISKSAVAAGTLQRVQPAGKSEIIRLKRTEYVMGRSPAADIKLYSPSASRDHAHLTNRDGRWYLTAVKRKSVIAAGVAVKGELMLKHKMRLQLGEDELIFFDESAPTLTEPEPPSAPSPAPSKLGWTIVALATAAAAAAAVFFH